VIRAGEIVLALALLVAVLIYAVTTWGKKSEGSKRELRGQVDAQRKLIDTLFDQALDARQLGEPFAQLVLTEINTHRKELK
jgi:hypothetical protein